MFLLEIPPASRLEGGLRAAVSEGAVRCSQFVSSSRGSYFLHGRQACRYDNELCGLVYPLVPEYTHEYTRAAFLRLRRAPRPGCERFLADSRLGASALYFYDETVLRGRILWRAVACLFQTPLHMQQALVEIFSA